MAIVTDVLDRCRDTALFGAELAVLRAGLDCASGYRGELADELRRLAHEEVDPAAGAWGFPARAVLRLLDGDLAGAREDFLREWRYGIELGRGLHYWNSPSFRHEHRWICAAMAAQLLVLFDWLVAAGALDEPEIDRVAEEAIVVFEAHIAPHNRGRGTLPLLHEPINQNAAMTVGLLVVGRCFGHRHRRDPRARRMYAEARQLLEECIGRHPRCGYDGDGMTYMRLIHPACFTLGVALLEAVEGGDHYARAHPPLGTSLATIMDRQLELVRPGGGSWPLGRYGYVREWNLFALAFASRRSGDPSYLQAARRDGVVASRSPWLAMDQVLALLWWPEGLDAAIDAAPPPVARRFRHHADGLGCLAAPDHRLFALHAWQSGHAPQLCLDLDEHPVLLGGSDTWSSVNGVHPDGFDWGSDGWLTPGARTLVATDLGAVQVQWLDTAPCYPAAVGVERAERRLVLLPGDRLVIDERYRDARGQGATWRALVPEPRVVGNAATIPTPGGELRLVTPDGDWRRAPPMRQVKTWDGASATLELPLAGERARVVATPHHEAVQAIDGGLEIGAWRLVDDGHGARHRSDAALLVEGPDRVAACDLRRLVGSETWLWTSHRCSVALEDGTLRVAGLPCGGVLALVTGDDRVLLRRGAGIALWSRCSRLRRLVVDGAVTSWRRNEELVSADDGGLSLPAPAPAVEQLRAQLTAADLPAERIAALGAVRAAVAHELAVEVAQQLRYDDAPPIAAGDWRTEATQVRLEAAATLGHLLARDQAPALLAFLRADLERVDAVQQAHALSPWTAQWWTSGARAAALDALLLLQSPPDGTELAAWRARDVIPHNQDALRRLAELALPPLG